jgi:hypothetical protein
MVPLSAGVVQQLSPGMRVEEINDRPCVADGVEVTRSPISATQEMFSEAEGVEC